MKRRSAVIASAVALALFGVVPRPGVAGSQTETYELHMDVPNIAEAPNGDRVFVSGGGVFSVHPKSVNAAGTLTHTDSNGNVLGSGTWEATQLLSFQLYGCGIVHPPEGDIDLPDNFCGGKLMMQVLLTAGGQQFEGTLTVFCIVGDNPPNSYDEPQEEGVRLNVIGVINFNKVVGGGENLYIRTN